MNQADKTTIASYVKAVIEDMDYSTQIDYIRNTMHQLHHTKKNIGMLVEAIGDHKIMLELITDKAWCELCGLKGDMDYSTAIRAGMVRYYYETKYADIE